MYFDIEDTDFSSNNEAIPSLFIGGEVIWELSAIGFMAYGRRYISMLTAPIDFRNISSTRDSLASIIARKDRLSYDQLKHLADLCEEVDPTLIPMIGLSDTKLMQVGKVIRCPEELVSDVNNLLTEVTRQPRKQRGVPMTRRQKRKLRQDKAKQRSMTQAFA